jgi:MerR family transcriptional regulator/heat shock protein HspR
MPENHKKIKITSDAKMPGHATAPPTSGVGAQRRSPVTDLLFDNPRFNTRPQNGQAAQEGQRPVFHISIVAEMVETHPQTLRMYERMGLISPQRTRNNIRLYSQEDVEQVRRIQHLTQDLGVNLAGVEVVFKLLREMHRLREEMEQEIEEARQHQEPQ